MNITWDAGNYRSNFAFVHTYGKDVLELIDAAKGALVVDLGCGNGELTHELKKSGFKVLGLDASREMLAIAREAYPELDFVEGNGLDFTLADKADAIFSNAVFHWIDRDRQDELAENIARNLKPGGKLVCEFGGKGCAELVHGTLERNFSERGLSYPRTFYFPSVGEYASVLERHGFKVEYAVLFDRPTPQKTRDGLVDWINMFVKKPFEDMLPELKRDILDSVREELKGRLYVDGTWIIDYVRIRVRAVYGG